MAQDLKFKQLLFQNMRTDRIALQINQHIQPLPPSLFHSSKTFHRVRELKLISNISDCQRVDGKPHILTDKTNEIQYMKESEA